MYCEYFGLRESPFSIAPNPRYLFMSEQHQEALAHLLYGIRIDGGFILLTGEVGTGKTTVSRQLIEQLPADAEVALILNPRQEAVELLQSICDELRISVPPGPGTASTKWLVDCLYRHLLQQHAEGRTTVLIIDEAQQLSPALLELVRLLTNLETSECKLLKIVLIGQPELLELLARDDLRQLSQRITARYHLGPLSHAELVDYMRHRLRVAGLDRPVFPPATLKQLYRLSGGIPRVINMISDRALLGTFVQKQNSVSVATLKRAAYEVFGDQLPTPRVLFQGRGGLVAGALLVGVLAWGAGLSLSLLNNDPALPEWLRAVTARWGEPPEQQLPVAVAQAADAGPGGAHNAAAVAHSAPAPSQLALATFVGTPVTALGTPDTSYVKPTGVLPSATTRAPAVPPVAPERLVSSTQENSLLRLAALDIQSSAVTASAERIAADSARLRGLGPTAIPTQPAQDEMSALPVPAAGAGLTETPAEVLRDAEVSSGAKVSSGAGGEAGDLVDWPRQSDPDLVEVLAYRKLFQLWGVDYDPRLQPVVCAFARQQALDCLTLYGDVELLRQLDTPAVTQLRQGGRTYQAVIRTLDAAQAEVSVGGQRRRVALDELQRAWSGQFTILWSLPPGYVAPIWPGASGETIRWLDVQLARAEGRVLTRSEMQRYDSALVQRVRLFQQQQGLAVDGVVGPRTIILLNKATRNDLPRLVAASQL